MDARVGVAYIELVSIGDVVTVVVGAGVELDRIVQVVGNLIAVFVPVLVGTAGITRVRPERQLIRVAQAISIRVVLGNTGITAARFFFRVGDAVPSISSLVGSTSGSVQSGTPSQSASVSVSGLAGSHGS